MKSRLKWTLFSFVLVFYAFIYIATSKEMPCDEICDKFMAASSMIEKDRAYIRWASRCRDTSLCINVDTSARNWNALADTACMYLNGLNLNNYRVIITTTRGDTVANKKCP
jgi:hypothetical protein